MSTLRITDLNREGGIGSNCLLVEWGPFRFVVDSGLHPKLVGRPALPDFSLIHDGSLDFVILTHCHLDHLGSLPVLMRANPFCEVILSHASAKLAGRMMRNSVTVMKRQREELGIVELPLYTHSDVDLTESLFHPLTYDRPRVLEQNGLELEISLHPSGHIPGAASALLRMDNRSVFFTGDVLFENQRILAGAALPDTEVDVLVTETTHGARERAVDVSRESEVERFLDLVEDVTSGGGNILVPVFALGRMQEMAAILCHEVRRGRFAETRFHGAGLGMDIANYFDELARKGGFVDFRLKMLNDLRIRPLPRDLRPGSSPAGPGVFLLSSGMMVEHTPSYHFAASILEDPASAIAFVGYCDPDTPGAAIQETEPGGNFLFRTLDYVATKRARVERFDLSGHAQRDELLDMILRFNPRNVVLTHGDAEARSWFETEIYSSVLEARVFDPVPLEPVEL